MSRKRCPRSNPDKDVRLRTAPEVIAVPVPDKTWTRDRLISQIAVNGVMANSLTTQTFAVGQLDEHGSVNQAVDSLKEKIAASKAGSTALSDELLIGQAVSLNAIYNEMMRRAALNISTPGLVDCYMRLGLKAQSQCRATLESLAKIKNPPSLAIVRQANIAQNQQVNIGHVRPGAVPARGEEDESTPIELLEGGNGKWLVPGTEAATCSGNSDLEAVGAVHGPTDLGREAEVEP